MAMIAYQCSRCKLLQDADDYVWCGADIDPRPNHREKGDAKRCRSNFAPLEKSEIWHEKIAWE